MKFHYKHRRNGRLLSQGVLKNSWTAEGTNNLVDAIFRQTISPPAQFYIGLMSAADSFFSGIDRGTDTLTSHPTWTDSEITRLPWNPEEVGEFGPSDIRFSNINDPVVFQLRASINLRGFFLASSLDNSGILFNTAISGGVDFEIGDELEIVYQLEIDTGGSAGFTDEGHLAVLGDYFLGESNLSGSFFVGLKDAVITGSTDTLASHPLWNEIGTRTSVTYSAPLEQHWQPRGPRSHAQALVLAPEGSLFIPGSNFTAKGWFLADVSSGDAGILIYQDDQNRATNGADDIIETVDGAGVTLFPWLRMDTF